MENRYRYIMRSSYHFACFTTGGISVLIDMNLAQYAIKSIVELRTALFWVVQASSCISLPMFRDSLSVLSSRVFLFCFLTPEDGTESSVRNYHHPLRNDSEERSSHLLRGGNLKSRLLNFYRRLGADVLVFLYTGYKAPSSS